jgi:MHS family proline/betaine transporter-like MFS transporter
MLTNKDMPLILGNFLEYYDFMLFVALTPILSVIFFPSSDPIIALTSTYLFLGVGFIARPVGAIFFGYYGDKFGRRKSLMISICLMTISTFSIGLLPSYEQIGFYSYIILGICRLCQGFSVGGEYIGAGITLFETKNDISEYTKGGYLTASGLMGTFFAALVVLGVTYYSSASSWSWRIPFIMGGVFGLIILFKRYMLEETTVFKNEVETVKNNFGFKNLFTKYKPQFYQAVLLGALMNAPFYLLFGFLNPYAVSQGMFEKNHIMIINSLVALLTGLGIAYAGRLEFLQKRPRVWLKRIALAFITLTPIILVVALNTNIIGYFIAQLVIIVLISLFCIPALVELVTAFPPATRFKGAALGNMVGNALFGGFCPYFCMQIVKYTNIVSFTAVYIMLIGVMLIHALRVVGKSAKQTA